MSSDESEKKNIEEPSKEASSSAEETEEKKDEEPKEEKVNNKAAAKKKGSDPPKIKQPAKKRVKSEQAEKENSKEEEKEEKKKAEEKEEDGEEEESDEENDVNHKVVPLLDQPLEVSGKRKSREVQRFKPVEPEEDNKEVKIPAGKGKPLGEIERIEFNIQRTKPEDLKLLHRLCFGKQGKAATVKKILKKFNGFEYSVDSDEYKKKKEFVEKSFKKVTMAQLKNVCHVLDIDRSGHKEDVIERILKFITCPVDSGKKLPGGGRSKRKGASNKNYEEGEETHKTKRKTKAKKKDVESEESDIEKDDEEDGVNEKEEEKKKEDKKADDSEDGRSEEEEEEEPKKPAKRGKKAADAADKKAPPKKRAAAKKAAEKKSDSEVDGDDSEDEEPLSKKVKTPPTDEDIKTYVKSLLEGANLELITMKKVCQDVYAHYPDFDLAHKKDFIKTTVKNLISS